MKVAIVHEWFTTWAGSENVVEQILECFPEADLYSLVDFLPDRDRARIGGRKASTSFIQALPFARTRYRGYLPLMPLAVEQFDLSGYDLVISSSHAVAKGVLTGPHQIHISYVHSPMRYAWDLQHQYLRESGLDRGLKGWVAKWLLHRMRIWDARTANGVDYFVANSRFIASRISKVYRREAAVIYPPVNVEAFCLGGARQDYYVTASRLVPYKRLDVVVDAFGGLPEKKLVVIGDGPDRAKLESRARSNVTFLGHQDRKSLVRHLQAAKAFVFAAEEDFGILPVEAQACGTPIIAYGRGGVTETVIADDSNQATGIFFPEQTAAAVRDAVSRFESRPQAISSTTCRANAERFSIAEFRRNFSAFVEQALAERGAR